MEDWEFWEDTEWEKDCEDGFCGLVLIFVIIVFLITMVMWFVGCFK